MVVVLLAGSGGQLGGGVTGIVVVGIESVTPVDVLVTVIGTVVVCASALVAIRLKIAIIFMW